MGAVEDRLAELGVELPSAPPPAAAYVPWARTGSLVYTAGQIPVKDGAVLHPGLVGGDVTLEDAQAAARQCAINVIAQLRAATDGDLDRVVRIVKLVVFVASSPDFTSQHLVANGASELMVAAFGDAGRHARSAVGMACLPMNASVEVEAIAEVS